MSLILLVSVVLVALGLAVVLVGVWLTALTGVGLGLLVYRDGKRIRLVAWRTRKAVYWVSNTLNQALSTDQMIGIARSLGARHLCLYGPDRVRFDTQGLLEPIHEDPQARCYRLLLP